MVSEDMETKSLKNYNCDCTCTPVQKYKTPQRDVDVVTCRVLCRWVQCDVPWHLCCL